MDKNLINIDDLVRQRLSGGEEQERAGAWLRMRELLDKEEERKPAAFIWRRMFGGVAILILVASVGLGGYELTNAYKTIGNDPKAIASATPAAISATSGVNTHDNTAIPGSTATGNNNQVPAGDNNPGTATAGSPAGNNQPANANTTSGSTPVAAGTSANADNLPQGTNSLAKHVNSKNNSTNANEVSDNNNSSNNEPKTIAKNNPATGHTTTHQPAVAGTSSFAGGHRAITAGNTDAKTRLSEATGIAGTPHTVATVATGDHNTNATGTPKADNNKTTSMSHPVLAAAASGANAVGVPTPAASKHNPASANHKGDHKTTDGSLPAATTGHNNGIAANTAAGNNAAASGKHTGTATNKDNVTGTTHNAVAATSSTPVGHNPATGDATVTGHKSIASKNNTASAGTTAPAGSATVAKHTGGHTAAKVATNVAGNKRTAIAGTDETGNTSIGAPAASGTTGNKKTSVAAPLATTGANALPASPAAAPANPRVLASASSGTSRTPGAISGNTPALAGNGTHSTGSKPGNNGTNGPAKGTAAAGTKTGSTATNGNNGGVNNKVPATTVALTTTPVTGNSSNTPALVTGPVINTHKGKKMIQKLTIHERLLPTSSNTFMSRLDTISNESINEEFTTTEEVTPGDAAAKKPGDYDETVANKANNELKIPGLTPHAAAKNAEPGKLKEQQQAKKGLGSKISSLQSAFNDIKYKIKGGQMAVGLTGGVNGTFFGPNSFKGFQFGVSGNYIISESVNLMAELKYIHRINNDYTMHDDYYIYTPDPTLAGYYTKELVNNTYSFSTLHSFEMPLLFRYTKSNFNFFFGGNLLYAMAVNEEVGIPTAQPNQLSRAASMSNDNAPKITANDFNARFGLGYIFGVSVQLNQALSIDLRDVQNVWDNASTPGAKQVSSQLYRSPSFQLSLAYRLGGKRGKDKE